MSCSEKKNSCSENRSKSLKNNREEIAGGGTSQLFFSIILTKVTAVRVKGQLFLRKPFFQDSSLQLLLSTRVTFDKSTVNVYSEYKE